MSTAPPSEPSTEIVRQDTSNLRWLWILALVVAIVAGGVLLWVMLSGDDEPEAPTITFDGTVAVYEGPATLPAGTVTFTLTNTHDTAVDLGTVQSTDSSLTSADAREWREANPDQPVPWFGRWDNVGVAMAGQTIDYDVTLDAETYELVVWDRFTETIYTVAVIEVTGT